LGRSWWISTEGGSFGLERKRKEPTIWLNEKECLHLKSKGALGLKILERKTLVFLLSGGGSWKIKMDFGKE
jgi:hypothetical protein